MALDVLQHHDRIVDHEANRDAQPHQRQVIEAVPERIHEGERPDQRQRDRHTRNRGCPEAAQKDKDDKHHQHNGQDQRELNVADGRADGRRPIAEHIDFDGSRDGRLQLRQQRLDAIHRLDDVGARLLEDRQQNGGLAVGPGRDFVVFRAIDGTPNVADTHRRAIAIGQDDVIPGLRAQQLIVVIDRERAGGAVDATLRTVGRCVRDHGTHVFQAQPHRGELFRIDLNTHRRLLLTVDADLGNAWNLADVLDQDVLGVVVDNGDRQRVGMQCENEDRRVGRIDLAIGRGRRQRFRQLPAGGVDGGLNVLRGAVDIAVEIELHRDRAVAERRG